MQYNKLYAVLGERKGSNIYIEVTGYEASWLYTPHYLSWADICYNIQVRED